MGQPGHPVLVHQPDATTPTLPGAQWPAGEDGGGGPLEPVVAGPRVARRPRVLGDAGAHCLGLL